MIGQRYQAHARADVLVKEATAARKVRRRRLRPAIGYAGLVEALGRSMLVQLMLAMSLVALAAMMYLAQAGQAAVLEVNINTLQNNHAHLLLQNATLRSSASSLQSLTRVETLAAGRLKMQRADLSTTIWIKPEVPRPVPVRPASDASRSAIRQSQPLAWMERAARELKNSL